MLQHVGLHFAYRCRGVAVSVKQRTELRLPTLALRDDNQSLCAGKCDGCSMIFAYQLKG